MHNTPIENACYWVVNLLHSPRRGALGAHASVLALVLALGLLFVAVRRHSRVAALHRRMATGAPLPTCAAPRKSVEIALILSIAGLAGASSYSLFGEQRALAADHMLRLSSATWTQVDYLGIFAVILGVAASVGFAGAWLAAMSRARFHGLLSAARETNSGVRDAWLLFPAPKASHALAALVVVELGGIVPVAWAIAGYADTLDLIRMHEANAVALLDDKRRLLALVFVLAGVTVVAGALLLRRAVTAAAESRRRACPALGVAPGLGRWPLLAVTVAATGAAVGLTVKTRPLVEEFKTPVAPGYSYAPDGCGCLPEISFPEGDGPDEVAEGPLIALFAHRTRVDGVDRDTVGDTASALAEKRALWSGVLPGKPYPGIALIAAAPSLDAGRVAELLAVLPRAGIRLVLFVFTRRIELVRPILGKVQGERTTALRLWLVPRAGADHVSLAGYTHVAEAMVGFNEVRSRGHEIMLDPSP